MTIPVIKIDGKEYKAKKPKARAWRELMKFDENKKDIKTDEFIDKHAELIASLFEDLSADDILDNVDIDDILKIYHDVFLWITELISSKLSVIPNAQKQLKKKN